MGRGYAGADVIATLEMDYEYLGHEYHDTKGALEEVRNILEMNLLLARDIDSYVTDIEHIGQQAVEYARSFIRQNMTWDTGRLHDSVEFVRVANNQMQLRAPARDEDNHPYAGHIEYGFTDRAGQGRGPWPFLRPAMRLAAADSRGMLADEMARLSLYGMMRDGGQISLGRSGNSFSRGKGQRAFYKMSNVYRRTDKEGKTFEWGKAYNGFNKDTSRNEYSISEAYNYAWDWGELG